jgi:Mg2+/Co2+ transporter CorB
VLVSEQHRRWLAYAILIAAPVLGAVYGEFGFAVACGSVAVILLLGAALIPHALRAVGVPDELGPATSLPPREARG